MDSNAPIEPPGIDPAVPVGDRNSPFDLLQMDSLGDGIGHFAGGGPRQVIFLLNLVGPFNTHLYIFHLTCDCLLTLC